MTLRQFNRDEFEALSLADAGQRLARELQLFELNSKDEKEARGKGDHEAAQKYGAMASANYFDYQDMVHAVTQMMARRL